MTLLFVGEGLSDSEIASKTSETVQKEYIKRIFEKIFNSKELDNLSPNIGKALVNHAHAVIIMRESVKKVEKMLTDHMNEYKKDLEKKHPIKSKIKTWLNERITKESVCQKKNYGKFLGFFYVFIIFYTIRKLLARKINIWHMNWQLKNAKKII